MTEVVPAALKPIGEQKKKGSAARLIFRLVIFAFAVFLFAPYLLTCVYIFADPPFSALMLRQTLAGRSVTYEWRDLDRISPNLIAQVIAAEDSRFCKHHGVDWTALNKAADAVAEGRPKGGGSTISMQAAKNLFLWNKPGGPAEAVRNPARLFHGFHARQAKAVGDIPQYRRMGAWHFRRGSGGAASFRHDGLRTSRLRKRPNLLPPCPTRNGATRAGRGRARWLWPTGFGRAP